MGMIYSRFHGKPTYFFRCGSAFTNVAPLRVANDNNDNVDGEMMVISMDDCLRNPAVAGKFTILTCSSKACAAKRQSLNQDEYVLACHSNIL